MKDCWHILGIQPTADVSIIRKSYLNLIKKYHPDTVYTPEKKRKYTIRCAEINVAYEEAIKKARLMADRPFDVSSAIVTERVKRPWYFTFVALFAFVGILIAVVIMMSVFMGFIFWVMTVTNIFGVVLYMIVFIALLGFFMLGMFDMALMLLFGMFRFSNLLYKIGLKKYEMKLIWFSMLIFNICIVYFTDFPLINLPGLLQEIYRFCLACTIPFLFALDWIKDIIKYTRVKKKGFVISVGDSMG
jgi:hypothetical protein